MTLHNVHGKALSSPEPQVMLQVAFPLLSLKNLRAKEESTHLLYTVATSGDLEWST